METIPSSPPSSERSRRSNSSMSVGARARLSAMSFLAGTLRGWSILDVHGWCAEQLVKPGWMARPLSFREVHTSDIIIEPEVITKGRNNRLVVIARSRVVRALQNLLPPVKDERFVKAAVHESRVTLKHEQGRCIWVPSPKVTDTLSDIVLSLFAADVLTNQDLYSSCLCVCDVCEQVFFEPNAKDRRSCLEHRAVLYDYAPASSEKPDKAPHSCS